MVEATQMIEAEIPRLRRYARFLAGDVDRADDLVQECLTRAIAKFGNYQPGTNLRAWLFTILRNCFFNELRHKKRSPFVDGADHSLGASPGNQFDHMALLDVRRAFLNLSDEHRDVLVLVAIEGMSYHEAAAMIGVPVGTVRSRASRAREALRAAVNHDGMDSSEPAEAPQTGPAHA